MTLGPQMTAEGWTEIGNQELFVDLVWLHQPSNRSVQISEIPRCDYEGPVWGPEPEDRSVSGYVVASRVHDDLGNPESGEGFWIASFGAALRIARQTRQKILAENERAKAWQLTLDDVLERNAAR